MPPRKRTYTQYPRTSQRISCINSRPWFSLSRVHDHALWVVWRHLAPRAAVPLPDARCEVPIQETGQHSVHSSRMGKLRNADGRHIFSASRRLHRQCRNTFKRGVLCNGIRDINTRLKEDNHCSSRAWPPIIYYVAITSLLWGEGTV